MEPLYRFALFYSVGTCGFTPIDIAFIYSVTQTWGILVHTERINKLGWLEYILVTPSHHRVHHGSNPKYLDKKILVCSSLYGINYSAPFNRNCPLLNTSNKIRAHQAYRKRNPCHPCFHEWDSMRKDLQKKGLSPRTGGNIFFISPGWSHDGSRHTSGEELRKMENENKQ